MQKKVSLIISIITIFLLTFLLTRENTISDLNFDSKVMDKLVGYQEPEGGVTYIEALGLNYLSLGSIFSYGVNDETIFYFYEQLLNSSLVEEDGTYSEDNLLDNKRKITNYDNSISLEKLCKIEETDYVDSHGVKVENEKLLTITTPNTFNKDTLKGVSNVWKFNYRMHNNGLVGVENAIWYGQAFDTTSVFNRAFYSLKWLFQEKIECEILEDFGDKIVVFVYGNDGYHWLVTVDKKHGDAFNFNKEVNYISMNTIPLNEEKALDVLKQYGIIKETN